MPAVTSPNLGLILDRPPINIPTRGLRDGHNFRCKNGTLESRNLGWERFSDNFTLNGPVILIDNFFPRGLEEKLIFGTATDLYVYDASTDNVLFLTPQVIYSTVTRTNGSAVISKTGGTFLTDGLKPGDGIYFTSGGLVKREPETDSGTFGWYYIQSVDTEEQITLDRVFTGPTSAAAQISVRQRFVLGPSASWSVDTFVNAGPSGDDLWFATNGVNYPFTWDGVTDFVTEHDELGFVCMTLTTYSNMMIYGNVTQSGSVLFSTIINSDVGLPLNAGATGTGISEQFVTHSGTDEILNMIPLGDYLIIYSERTIVPMQFVGDPLIFIFRVAISGVGPISANALADFGDFHEFIGSDAGYLFDGVTLKETNSHVWRDVLRQTDPMRRRQTYGHFDEEQGDLIWSLPNNADPGVGDPGQPPTIAWVEHYLEDAGDALDGSPFSKRDFPFTITGFYERQTGLLWSQVTEEWQNFNFAWNDQFFQAAFPLNLAGDYDGNIWILNQTQLANGAPLPSYVRTARMGSSDAARNRDLLTRIYPFARSLPYNLEVTLFMGDNVAGEPNSKGVQLFDMNLPEGGHFVTFYRRGRVREYQFGSSAGDPWVLEGWDEDMVRGGRR